MNNIMYLGLGIFDAFAVLVLMFKIYRLPILEYKLQFLLMSIGISVMSFIIRVVLNVPGIDLPLQVIAFILFTRYVIKIKFFYATLMTSMGICSYFVLQIAIYLTLTNTGLIEHDIVTQLGGWEVYLIQVSTILMVYIIGFLLKIFNLGFAFIVIPPHDFEIKEEYFSGPNRLLLVVNMIGLIIISVTLFFLFNQGALIIFPMMLLSSWLLYFYSKRRDMA